MKAVKFFHEAEHLFETLDGTQRADSHGERHPDHESDDERDLDAAQRPAAAHQDRQGSAHEGQNARHFEDGPVAQVGELLGGRTKTTSR